MQSGAKLKAKFIEYPNLPDGELESDAVVIVDGISAADVIKLATNRKAQHIIDKNSLNYSTEMIVAENMILRPQNFIADPLDFILPSILSAEGNKAKNFAVECAATDDKKLYLDQLQSFVRSVPGSKSVLHDIISAADEIFTNASKNTGVFYHRKGANLKSTQVQQGRLILCARATKDTIVIGCRDSYGLLDIDMLMNKIQHCYTHGLASSINMGAGGAGIGSFLVFNSAMNIYYAVQKNKTTAVFCSFPLGLRPKVAQMLPKNLHLLTFK